MANSKKIEKVQKLLLKAGSTDSPQEAESLFAAAQKLMIKWRIEEADLETNEQGNIILPNEVQCFQRRLEGNWELRLARSLCHFNGCEFVYCKYSSKITFYGTEQDTKLVKYFFETSRETFRRIARREYSRIKKESQQEPPKKNKYIRSFLLGACTGLMSKLYEAEKEVLKNTEGVSSNEYSLALRNSVQRASDYIAENVSTESRKSRTSVGDSSAYNSGVKTGKKHNLSIPLQGKSTNNKNIMKLC